MNLLVTGGAGFIGSNLIRHLINQPEITRLVNLDCLTYAGHLANLRDVEGNSKYTFEQVDLRDKAAVNDTVKRNGITHVMHLAAESHVDRSITGPDDFIQTNVVGTFAMLNDPQGVEVLRSPRASDSGGARQLCMTAPLVARTKHSVPIHFTLAPRENR